MLNVNVTSTAIVFVPIVGLTISIEDNGKQPALSVRNRDWHNGVAQNKMQTSASGILDASAESYKFRPNASVFPVVFESEPELASSTG